MAYSVLVCTLYSVHMHAADIAYLSQNFYSEQYWSITQYFFWKPVSVKNAMKLIVFEDVLV